MIAGHCLNLSESGLLATFVRPLDLWTKGLLTLQVADCTCTVPAGVARVEDRQGGLAFHYRSEEERDFVRRALALAAQNHCLLGRAAL